MLLQGQNQVCLVFYFLNFFIYLFIFFHFISFLKSAYLWTLKRYYTLIPALMSRKFVAEYIFLWDFKCIKLQIKLLFHLTTTSISFEKCHHLSDKIYFPLQFLSNCGGPFINMSYLFFLTFNCDLISSKNNPFFPPC